MFVVEKKTELEIMHAAGATPLDSQTLAWHCQKTENSVFCAKPNRNRPTTENVKL